MSVVLATAGYDHKIRFWEAPSGRCSRIIKFPDSAINRLVISPNKQFIAAAGNPAIRVYEVADSTSSNNGLGGGSDVTQQAVLTLEGHTGNVTAIGFQNDGRYLYSSSEDGTIKVWDLRNPNYSRSFNVGAAVNCVTLRQDRDEFISGDQNGYVKIWDLASGGCVNSLRPSAGNIPLSPEPSNGNGGSGAHSLASGERGYMNNQQNQYHRRHRHFYSEGTVPIQAVDISEDSRTLVAISNHGTVFVWDPSISAPASSPPPLHVEDGGDGPNINMALNSEPSTSLLRPITKFRAHAPGTYCLHGKMAPDCRSLVTCSSDGSARLWDTTTWELTATLTGHQKWVWDAAFCADSTYLVTASSDHCARLWNLRSGEVVRQYHGHESAVTCVALNDSNVM